MSVFSRLFSHAGSGTSTGGYYKSMNEALLKLNDEYTMLHYPLYGSGTDSFLEAQKNLTDYCVSLVPSVKGKTLLEVGCGNGVQAIHILEKFAPGLLTAIDLNDGNIDIARKELVNRGIEGIIFHVDDAQTLSTIESNSVDGVINIESAFHYPDKALFLQQVYRVLKPGGSFVIADILTRTSKRKGLKGRWKKNMSFHHWPLSSYEAGFPAAGFPEITSTDITNEVIRGFSQYRRWLREMKKRHFLDDLLLKLYYTIHTRVNIHLLKSKRQYVVFTGKKPA